MIDKFKIYSFKLLLFDRIGYTMHAHCIALCIIDRSVKRLIAINHIQNIRFCLHNISVCTVYNYYVYINTNTCMYIFKKNMLCLYIKYTYTVYNIKYNNINKSMYIIFSKYILCVCVFIYIHDQ